MHTPEQRLDCRLVVLQPALPHYRRPFFARLAKRVASLTVLHGAHSLPGETAAPATIDGVETVAVDHRNIGPLRWMPSMSRAAGDRRYQVAVFSWNTRYLHLPHAIARARRARRGVVLWGHGYSLDESRIRQTYRNLLGRWADAVVTYNRRAARQVVDAGVTADRVFVAPNALGGDAIDAAIRRWTDTPEPLRQFRDGLGLNGHPVALHVSRLGNPAALRTLVETWREVVTRVPGAQLVVVGDGPARQTLVCDLARAGLSESVRCVGPVFGEEAIAPYFLSARLLLHPVKIGLSLNHAMGYGLPVVTFDDPARHSPEFEALEHGSNGMMAAHGDVRALAANAAQLLLDGELAARLGRQASDTMRSRYSMDAMVAGFLDAVGRANACGSR